MKNIWYVVVLAACGKQSETPTTCAPLAVRVDGQPLPAMPHGLAKANTINGDVAYEVQLFSHDKATCDELLNKAGRQIPDGEVSVRAFAGGAGMSGNGVAIDAHTQMGGRVSLMGDKPKAVGDAVKICVDNAAFKPIAGVYKDKNVVVNGLFEGKYCGDMKW